MPGEKDTRRFLPPAATGPPLAPHLASAANQNEYKCAPPRSVNRSRPVPAPSLTPPAVAGPGAAAACCAPSALPCVAAAAAAVAHATPLQFVQKSEM